MPGPELDDFLKRYAYPKMKAAGYTRKRREAIFHGPRGMLGVVAFYPNRDMLYSPGFTLQYGVVPPLFRAWRREHGLTEFAWMSQSEALLMVQAVTPDWSENSESPTAMPERWPLDSDSDNERLGHHLDVTLDYEVFPTVEAWFDPVTLANAIEENRRGRFTGLGPVPRCVAMALAANGPSERLWRTVDSLPPEDNVRVWIEARFGQANK